VPVLGVKRRVLQLLCRTLQWTRREVVHLALVQAVDELVLEGGAGLSFVVGVGLLLLEAVLSSGVDLALVLLAILVAEGLLQNKLDLAFGGALAHAGLERIGRIRVETLLLPLIVAVQEVRA